MSALSLSEALAQVPDPRSRHGRRFPLHAILSLLTLGFLMGRTNVAAALQLGSDYGPGLILALGFPHAVLPAPSTLSKLLRRLDVAAVEAVLADWMQSRLPPGTDRLALDGKTLRGSRDGTIPGQHLLAAYAPQAQAVLTQLRVDAKTNEHKAALRLLGILPLRDKVVTGDAMFCQRDVAQQIVDAGGDYVFVVKENQLGLQTDIAAGFGFEAAARSVAAAFPPGTPTATGGACGDDAGQGPRAGGEADGADDDDSDAAGEMAGSAARVSGDA